MSMFQLCVIVASSPAQASRIQGRIDERIARGLYPREIDFHVLSDPERGRVGSGGATILAALHVRSRLEKGQAALVINAGGESRRMPAYAPEGKLFAPLPLPSSSIVPPVILDEQIGLFLHYPWNEGEMVATSGDVTIRFDTTTLPRERGDVYGFAKAESFDLGAQHGVFRFDRNRARVIDFYQKESVAFLRTQAALEGSRTCAVDMGVVGFSPRGLARLYNLAEVVAPGRASFADLLSGGDINLDLYVEILMAFVPGLTIRGYREKVGSQSHVQERDLECVFGALHDVDFRAFLTRGTQFLHFGSLGEYPVSCEELATSGNLPFYGGDDAEIRPVVSESTVQFNSIDCSLGVKVGARHVYAESCARSKIASLCGQNLVVGLENRHFESSLPPGICVEERRTAVGSFLIAYGAEDTWRPQTVADQVTYCGGSLAAWASQRDIPLDCLQPTGVSPERLQWDLWNLRLFMPHTEERWVEGLWNADIADSRWRKRFMEERRYSLREIADSEQLEEREGRRIGIRRELLREAISRGHGWLSVSEQDFRAAFGASDIGALRRYADAADDDLVRIYRQKLVYAVDPSSARADSIVSLNVDYLDEQGSRRPLHRSVKLDQIVWARSPVRLDLAGGWTDTPPFTLREGGEVVNVAVNLNGQPPIQVFCRPTTDPMIRIHSIDLGLGETIREFSQLEDYNRPGSAFALPKAALCLLGLTADLSQGYSLQERLEKIGCGVEITLLSAIPKGSGLGTSSILGGTILGSLERFFGLDVARDELFRQVLQMEQMLTTGGGWQDQIGGIAGGVKYISTLAGLRPNPAVYQLDPYVFEAPECADRFTLYYTGITRLAKNILQEVVDRVNTMEPAYLFTLRYMKELSRRAREAVSQRDLVALAQVLNASWNENKLVHESTTNGEVERLLESVAGLYSGMKLLGAGGGGYILFISDSVEIAHRLSERLAMAEDDRARLVDMRINQDGLRVTVS